jgi:hypothetical protein
MLRKGTELLSLIKYVHGNNAYENVTSDIVPNILVHMLSSQIYINFISILYQFYTNLSSFISMLHLYLSSNLHQFIIKFSSILQQLYINFTPTLHKFIIKFTSNNHQFCIN